MDKIICFSLAISPILQHYIGIFNSFSVNILIICLPYLSYHIIKRHSIVIQQLMPVIPIIVFEFYKMIIDEMSLSSVAHAVICSIVYIALSQRYIDTDLFCNYTRKIAVFASVLIIIQTISFYFLGFHLQLVPTQLLLSNAEQWIPGVETGLISITGTLNGFYRPSSFFLEPSHFFIYVFPHLLLALFLPDINNRIKCLFIISIGLLCSTSGMGIMVLCFAWVLFVTFYSKQSKTIECKMVFRKRIALVYVALLLLFACLYNEIDIIQSTIDRIFIGDAYGNTAITGRTREGLLLLDSMGGKEWIFGVTTDTSDIEFNLSGLVAVLYKYGIIGMVLSYTFYVYSVVNLRGVYKIISAVILLISFFVAHTHGTFYMLYYSLVLMDGYLKK